MGNVVEKIFSENIYKLKALPVLNREQQQRYDILTLKEVFLNYQIHEHPRYYIARLIKSSWEAYIEAADMFGFFNGIEGGNLLLAYARKRQTIFKLLCQNVKLFGIYLTS